MPLSGCHTGGGDRCAHPREVVGFVYSREIGLVTQSSYFFRVSDAPVSLRISTGSAARETVHNEGTFVEVYGALSR